MKGLDSGPNSARAAADTDAAPEMEKSGTGFPLSLSEALDILADRARRRGLTEVVHLIEVASMAARDAAASPADEDSRP